MRDGQKVIRADALLVALFVVATLPALFGVVGYAVSVALIAAAWFVAMLEGRDA